MAKRMDNDMATGNTEGQKGMRVTRSNVFFMTS